MEDTSKIYQALAEIYDIILNSDDELRNKIPQTLKDIIRDKKDESYLVRIDYSKELDEQELLIETKELLSLIYTDYLCSEEERQEIVQNNFDIQQKMIEKYSILNFFESRNQYITPNTTTALPIKVEEKKWYQVLFEKIVKLFKNVKKFAIIT